MNILLLNKFFYPWIGGVEDHVKTLAEQLAKTNNITILTTRSSLSKTQKGLPYKLIEARNFCRFFGKDRFFSMPLSFDFIGKFRKLAYHNDIVHVHLPNPWAVITILLFSSYKDVVVTYHSDIKKQKLFFFFYKPLLYYFLRKRVKIIITTSDNLRKNSPVLRHFQRKVEVIPLGIDFSTLEYDPVFYKKLAEKYKKSPLILFVGRLVSYKGVSYLIKAFSRLKNDAQLIIIGSGVLENELRKLTAKLNLNNKINFIRPQAKKYLHAYYKAADILVLPSISETEAFGLVQIEAMYHKTAIINTSLPTGVPFVSKHNESGYTVPPKNSKKMAQKIDKLLSSKSALNKLQENAHKRAKKLFDSKKMADNTLRLYQQI